MDTDTQTSTNGMQYRIEHGAIYKYIVFYRRIPDPSKGVFGVDNPWHTCKMTNSYNDAMNFIQDQKNKKIGVIL